MIYLVLAVVLWGAYPQSVPQKQGQTKTQENPTRQIPLSTTKPATAVPIPVAEPSPNPEANESTHKSKWPPLSDIFWPSWALVIVTALAVRYAIKTLGAIKAQVEEMQTTGQQTDKLIQEAIRQSEEAAKLAKAMEATAKGIEASTKVGMDSVAIGTQRSAQQLRAYICVAVGGAVYQERAKNLKFLAQSTLVNTGNTPAHKLGFKVKAAVLPVPLPEDFSFPLPSTTIGSMVVGPGPQQNITLTATVDDFVPDQDVDAIKVLNGHGLYIWGIIEYEDVFQQRQITRFSQLLHWLGDRVMGIYLERHNDAT
jgi:hypothetical protein